MVAAKLGWTLEEVWAAPDRCEWFALALLEGWTTAGLSVAGDTKSIEPMSVTQIANAYGYIHPGLQDHGRHV